MNELDKTGRPDFAMESLGGEIVSIHDTELMETTLFGLVLNPARFILQVHLLHYQIHFLMIDKSIPIQRYFSSPPYILANVLPSAV